MAKKTSSYVIGIDLGTTNCTMAYAQADSEEPSHEIVQAAIPQVVGASEQAERYSLPSFLYFPLEEEVSAGIAGIEWDPKRQHCVGVFARDRGTELPSQLIASAKSWLCHDGIDRRAKLLPRGDSPQMSPLEGCAELLRHLREAWDHQMPGTPFAEQKVLVTVPASFDPSARQLVQEATELAGYPEVILLEEPQAAFYAWLHRHAEDWRDRLSVGDHVLVVDVGGGTTDFTLIRVEEEQGDLVLERAAVGAHLLLGGDNMDLALAYQAKKKLEEGGHAIDEWQLQGLVHRCRAAKERLLGPEGEESVDITVHGRGSRLIGGTVTTQLDQEEIRQAIVEGFFPLVSSQERSAPEQRSGIQQVGLPYAQDPRISSQLAKFLSMTGESHSDAMDRFVVPSAVLFNGGAVKALALQERLVEQLNRWAEELGQEPVTVLPDSDLDHAVSRGAVYYGLARAGKGIRIKGGTSRSYYIGVEAAAPAVPGMPVPLKAVCVVPFGMEEGTEQELSDQEFALVLGEQATFRFFSHATPTLENDDQPVMGTAVSQWKEQLSELHPIETVLDRSGDDGKTICVMLKSKVTELGVLELWCVANDGRQWKLEFDIREKLALAHQEL